MAGGSREDQVLAAIRRVLDPDERMVGHAWCWLAWPRPHVPLLVLGRHRHEAFVTEHRLILVARRRRALRPSDVVLATRFDALALLQQHRRTTLLQQRLQTDSGSVLVLEWPRRSHDLAWILAGALRSRHGREVA